MGELGHVHEKGKLEEEFKRIRKDDKEKERRESAKLRPNAIVFSQFAEFLIAEKTSKMKLEKLLFERATTIYNTYIASTAPLQVNIKGPTQKNIEEEIKSGHVTAHTFDKAEKEILKLLVRHCRALRPPPSTLCLLFSSSSFVSNDQSADSFNRFKQSALFQVCALSLRTRLLLANVGAIACPMCLVFGCCRNF